MISRAIAASVLNILGGGENVSKVELIGRLVLLGIGLFGIVWVILNW